MAAMDFIALLARFIGDALVLILLYDFFSQPFRFYGMDPFTRFVWVAARKICLPFEALSRSIIRLPDRDLTPLFALAILLFCRGFVYAVTAMTEGAGLTLIAAGVCLSFLECFTRLMIPGLLFIIYLDIQFAPHKGSFSGNVFVMILQDIAKRFIVLIRKGLISYRPVSVFITVFLYLAFFKWVLLLVSLVPFAHAGVLDAFPIILRPVGVELLDRPFLLLPAVMVHLSSTFLYGVFILLLLNMLASFSGLDPYDRFSILLGLVCSPWVILARRFFSFARFGNIDFSVGVLLILLFLLQGILENTLRYYAGFH